MTTTRPLPTLRFLPHPLAAALHLALLAAAFALFMGRKPGVFRSDTLAGLLPGVYTHISNFSISYLLLAGVGYLWLMAGATFRLVAWAGVALAAVNVVYETWIPVLNTRDPVDAAYGVVGTALAAAVLGLVARYGLRPAPAARTAE